MNQQLKFTALQVEHSLRHGYPSVERIKGADTIAALLEALEVAERDAARWNYAADNMRISAGNGNLVWSSKEHATEAIDAAIAAQGAKT
jgi:hypothetical protein